jgi:ABC-type sugar transport system ATPase subunit
VSTRPPTDRDEPPADAEPPLVRMRGIRKAFPGVVALDDVDLELRAGEIHTLAGENGSGKSTLAKILYGALAADEGVIELGGTAVTFSSPRAALERGIVAISQELTLAPTLTVAENILMGRLPRRGPAIDWRRARALARAALDELGVEVDPERRVGELSIELQQEVEIARAVSASPRVLILDEATSSLSESATERLLARLQRLREQGVAILFISHRLRELYSCAQRATVLRDGCLIGTVELPACPEHDLVRMMVGREISDLFNKRAIAPGEPVLTVRNLTTEGGQLTGIDLTVCRGEIVGVAGLVGSGKTELGLALAGAIAATGEVEVNRRPLRLRSPRRAIAAGIGFVAEDRKRSSIFPTRSVMQNLSVAWAARLVRFGIFNTFAERRLATSTVERFAVRTRSVDTPITQLSGGNQQKLIIGRRFTLDTDVVVLTDPTRGIDVGAKSEVYRFIQDKAETGVAVLLISSELPELLGLADRIVVMFRGAICAEFGASAALEEEIAHAALGGAAPREVPVA